MHTNVYWIHHPEHTDVFTQGYIGVTKQIKARWKAHSEKTENASLKNAIKKYGWNSLIKKIILISDDQYCYDIEKKLRPKENIGWNINIGGTKPPIAKFRGENYVSPLKGKSRETPWMFGRVPANKGKPASEETRKKLSEIAKGKKNSSEHLAKRMESRRITRIARGQIKPLIVNGIQYESSKIASTTLNIPAPTLKYWAYGKGSPSKKYVHITECRWVS